LANYNATAGVAMTVETNPATLDVMFGHSFYYNVIPAAYPNAAITVTTTGGTVV